MGGGEKGRGRGGHNSQWGERRLVQTHMNNSAFALAGTSRARRLTITTRDKTRPGGLAPPHREIEATTEEREGWMEARLSLLKCLHRMYRPSGVNVKQKGG
jgi:hypothetical protein